MPLTGIYQNLCYSKACRKEAPVYCLVKVDNFLARAFVDVLFDVVKHSHCVA